MCDAVCQMDTRDHIVNIIRKQHEYTTKYILDDLDIVKHETATSVLKS